MPYNPGTQYRGDVYLAQGISGAGDALAKGLEKFAEERKEAKAVETALGAVGSAVQHMVKQQVLPADFLTKFQVAASGTTAQKRAALESVGMVLKFADQAQTMQARKQEMETRGAEAAREATAFKASQEFPKALGRELTPRTLPAMQVPGVSGYAGRPGAPMAGPVQLPAQTITPEFDAGAIARAAMASNAPMLPQQATGLLRYGGGLTASQEVQAELARQRLAQGQQRIDLERARVLADASTMSPKEIRNQIFAIRRQRDATSFLDEDQKKTLTSRLGAYLEAAQARGIEVIGEEPAAAGEEKPVVTAKGPKPTTPGKKKDDQLRNKQTGVVWTWDGTDWK